MEWMKQQWMKLKATQETERAFATAGGIAVVAPHAETLFTIGGQNLLSESGRGVVRDMFEKLGQVAVNHCGDTIDQVLAQSVRVATKQSAKVLAKESLIEGGKATARQGTKALAKQATKRAVAEGSKATARQGSKVLAKQAAQQAVVEGVKQSAKAATREILKGAGRAAGLGAAIDCTFATVEAVAGYHKGTLDGRCAFKHVAVETGTGGVATGTGVLIAAGAVALTGAGAIAAPVVIAIGIGATVLTKLGLTKLFKRSNGSTT